MEIELTPEQIANHYAAAMDSVALINAGKPADMSDEEWAECLSRNKEHLKLQIEKADLYAGYDIEPFKNAVK